MNTLDNAGAEEIRTIQRKLKVSSMNIEVGYSDESTRPVVNITTSYEYVFLDTTTNKQARPPQYAGTVVDEDVMEKGIVKLNEALIYLHGLARNRFQSAR